MRRYKVYKFRRQALGLTQAELANSAGMTANVVSRYEAGEEVSEPYKIAMNTVIDNMMRNLSEIDHLQVQIHANTLQLMEEENDQDRLMTLNYLAVYIGRLQLAIMKNQ